MRSACSPDAPSATDAQQLVLVDGQRVAGLGTATARGRRSRRSAKRAGRVRATSRADRGRRSSPRRAEHGVRASTGCGSGCPQACTIDDADSPRRRRLSGARARPAAAHRHRARGAARELTFVQHFIDCGDASRGWTNSVTQIEQARGSRARALPDAATRAPTPSHTVAAVSGARGARRADRSATSTSAPPRPQRRGQ